MAYWDKLLNKGAEITTINKKTKAVRVITRDNYNFMDALTLKFHKDEYIIKIKE